MDVNEVLDDLIAEQRALDDVVAPLTPEQWALPTPSRRWSISDQIGHLAYFDTMAALAIAEPPVFAEHRSELLATIDDELAAEATTLDEFRRLSPVEQLVRWRARRDDLERAGRTLSDDVRVEWYGPSMGAKSFLTARLMEVWAHGQDICDTIGAERQPTDRIRHIAQLGVITRGWSYLVRGEQPPADGVKVELDGPSGESWAWGPPEATSAVTGPALDFCLVVTQRRHVDDTRLAVTGEPAREWMLLAQAFAGPPTIGPPTQNSRSLQPTAPQKDD